MRVPFIDLAIQHEQIEQDVNRAIAGVMSHSAFVHGPDVARFERQFADFLEVTHAIGVANGTDALHLALRACGIGPGDEVITAANTFIATTEAISAAGASIVLVDIDPKTYTIAPDKIEAAITPRTKAIIPVHLYGQPADMDPILALAAAYGLVVIEDACQAHGARYRGQRVGTIGAVGCFSCYPGKNLGAYGDAGVVTTNDDAIADRLRLLTNHGSRKKYHHEIEGWNSRLDSIQAAVLGVKLPHLERWNAERQDAAARYSALLEGSDVDTPTITNDDHVWHLYVIESPRRDELSTALAAEGISTGIHYPVPLHLQPAYRHLGYRPGAFPATERAAKRILSLPMFPGLSDAQVEYVASAIWSRARAAVAV